MFKSIDSIINTITWLLVIFIPLGMWKLVDIAVWLFTHVNVSVG